MSGCPHRGRRAEQLVLPLPVHKAVLEEGIKAIDEADTRVQRLEELLAATVPQWRLYPVVQALMCMRGFQIVAATTIVADGARSAEMAQPEAQRRVSRAGAHAVGGEANNLATSAASITRAN